MGMTTPAEHRALRDAVREFLTATSKPAEVLADQDTELGYRPEMWATIAEQLELQGMLVDAKYGGSGAGIGDLVVVAEEFGRSAACSPFFASSVLTTLAIADCAQEHWLSELLPGLAAGTRLGCLAFADADGWWQAGSEAVRAHPDGDGWRIDGRADHVIFGHCADTVVVVARTEDGTGLFLVEPSDTSIRRVRRSALDQTRPLTTFTFDSAAAQRISDTTDISETLSRALDQALVVQAAERVGGARRCLHLTTDYAKTRNQFGRPIGTNQAVKHGLADLIRALEPVAAAVAVAAHAADTDAPELPALVSVLCVAGTERYLQIAGETIQLHGAIGFTWEHEAHLHLKRAKTDQLMFGSSAWHRERLLAGVLATGTAVEAPARADEPAPLADLQTEVRAWLAEHRAEGTPLEYAQEPFGHEDTDAEKHWTDLLRQGRWLCLSWPEEHGGRGLGPVETLVVEEEFARAGLRRPQLGMGETLLAPALLAHGSEDQKRRFLPRILSGEDTWCQGFSEPETGSDLASLRTSGTVDGDELRINGDKIWTSHGGQANMMFLLCRTDRDAPRHQGISFVLVPMTDNGIDVDPIRMASGDRGFAQERITDARAPLSNVVGGLCNGWAVAMTTLGAERAGKAATQYVGYRHELDVLAERLDKNGRLGDVIVRQRLAELVVEVELMRAVGSVIGARVAEGETVDKLLAIDKVNWSEYHCVFGSTALELLGASALTRPDGDGYQLDSLQRVFLESRGRRIARGSNQIQRNIIGERILGLPT
ncbi:acyl-CoA dehydrogenase [Rhodococcus opacus]|uniref:acyl-CoA dehydrogenase n=1 Tax=Rhodococcus opacus TaxID=37919 RepID=UPI0002A1EDD4|nr:acyl-CoA dehydrogenase [Rhodococcus wratislaviensis IFP 2016]NKY75564.1 acyl-CoA dehydrogenase [Rhodococcus opacus]CAG7579859.1 Crotonobetainyl-CoA dehydrogenase [Rhodococcus opacus]